MNIFVYASWCVYYSDFISKCFGQKCSRVYLILKEKHHVSSFIFINFGCSYLLALLNYESVIFYKSLIKINFMYLILLLCFFFEFFITNITPLFLVSLHPSYFTGQRVMLDCINIDENIDD